MGDTERSTGRQSRTSVWLSRRRGTKGPSGGGFMNAVLICGSSHSLLCPEVDGLSGGKLPRFASGVESSKITTEKAFLYPACPFDHTIIMGGSSSHTHRV
jgi:hypothetical protein